VLPVSIITGFLSSGKTTLLNRLLGHEEFKNSLVIINEFGEVGIDHLLVSAPADRACATACGRSAGCRESDRKIAPHGRSILATG
jgi:G3E family GTPase